MSDANRVAPGASGRFGAEDHVEIVQGVASAVISGEIARRQLRVRVDATCGNGEVVAGSGTRAGGVLAGSDRAREPARNSSPGSADPSPVADCRDDGGIQAMEGARD